jgi:hypothetical protein
LRASVRHTNGARDETRLRGKRPRAAARGLRFQGRGRAARQPPDQTQTLHLPGLPPLVGLHTIKRHRGRAENVVILEVDVPRRWLRRSKRGLWYSRRDIPPERIRGVVTFAALARSPAGETAGR